MYLKSVMSKFKLSFKKLSLVKVLSLGIIVIGLGCISWSFNAKLTMTTCYPFYFIGYALERYIVFANLVKNK
ncbi:hypothetical protein [Clostridium sporogenes]|uniref:hypothetical protein n=1 Tax=Clostridium sporogenes TaxID=1509 RepID=UPI0013D639A6